MLKFEFVISFKTKTVLCSYIRKEIRQLNTGFLITKKSLTQKTYHEERMINIYFALDFGCIDLQPI